MRKVLKGLIVCGLSSTVMVLAAAAAVPAAAADIDVRVAVAPGQGIDVKSFKFAVGGTVDEEGGASSGSNAAPDRLLDVNIGVGFAA
ncbi:hypothetical protein [Streptomyces sp. I05A-00742]|uniref:hypothetical protein n=1 Tax=Streptomyces sp. I05A-00742 TaxID=2732853 RepID=UPI001489352F|nr:hypothetical protein [Streptomyces sp. I05A-00742]